MVKRYQTTVDRFEYDALAAQCLELRERVAFLESREVCTAAHDAVEMCGYCQRDALQKRMAEAEMLLKQCSAVWHDQGPLPAIIAGFLDRTTNRETDAP